MKAGMLWVVVWSENTGVCEKQLADVLEDNCRAYLKGGSPGGPLALAASLEGAQEERRRLARERKELGDGDIPV